MKEWTVFSRAGSRAGLLGKAKTRPEVVKLLSEVGPMSNLKDIKLGGRSVLATVVFSLLRDSGLTIAKRPIQPKTL